jgi:hypothetical protein
MIAICHHSAVEDKSTRCRSASYIWLRRPYGHQHHCWNHKLAFRQPALRQKLPVHDETCSVRASVHLGGSARRTFPTGQLNPVRGNVLLHVSDLALDKLLFILYTHCGLPSHYCRYVFSTSRPTSNDPLVVHRRRNCSLSHHQKRSFSSFRKYCCLACSFRSIAGHMQTKQHVASSRLTVCLA